MKITLFTVVVLTAVALSSAADPECVYRKKSGLDLHWANPEHCGRFYRCSRGIKREIICPGEREYDAYSGKCVSPGMGTCHQNEIANFALSTDNTNDNVCYGAVDGAHFPKYGYCRDFYICKDNQGYEQNCDSGSYFDAKKAVCMPDTDSSCWQNTCLNQTDGYTFADQYNCAQYFVCNTEEAVQQTCPTGSFFNVLETACEPDTDKTCWVNYCSALANGTRLAVANNTHAYYECQNSLATLAFCVEDGTFDAATSQCLLPAVTTDATETTEVTETTETIEAITTTTHCETDETTTPCAPTEATTITQTQQDAVAETTTPCVAVETTTTPCITETTTAHCQQKTETVTCPGGSEQGDLVANPDNCMSFYICNNGELYEYNCGAGNFFDADAKICEHDTEGKCPQCHTALRQKRSVAADCSCPGGYPEGDLIKHETDCDKFFICHDGKLIEESCQYGNLFDSCNKVCVPDVDHTCWPVNSCKAQANGTILSNPKDCARYIVCQNEEEQTESCDVNDYFNSEKGYCMPDPDLQCVNPCANTTKIVFKPYPIDCKKFYFCNAGKAYIENCTTGFFDAERSLCLENTLCSTNICVDQPEGSTFPVANSTKKFEVCLNNVPLTRSCPQGRIFDADRGICMEEPSSNCDQTVCVNSTSAAAFSTINNSVDSFCICQNNTAYEYDCPAQYSFNAAIGICYSNAPCDPDICDNEPEYFVSANRNNSHSFCLCVTKEPVIVDCPHNGLFNPKLGINGECQPFVESHADCDDQYCLNETDYAIFPAKNENNGFCYCNNTAANYKACPENSQFNSTLKICVPDCGVERCLNATEGFTFSDVNAANSFCYCINSTAVKKIDCPTGKYYNDLMGLCDTVACDKSVCQDTTRNNDPFAANERPYSFCVCDGTEPRLYNCTEGSVFNGQICIKEIYTQCNVTLCLNANASNPYPIPALNDSSAFCYCFGPDTVEKFYCPADKLYDEKLQICDSGVSNSSTNNTDCSGRYQEGQFIPDSEDCHKYYICSDGVLQQGDCGAGNFFDSSCNYCKPDVNQVCQDNVQCTCVGGYKEGQMLPHPDSCQLFYICSAGKLHEMDCGQGNYFDRDEGICVAKTRQSRSLALLTDDDEDVRMFKGLSNFFKKLTQF